MVIFLIQRYKLHRMTQDLLFLKWGASFLWLSSLYYPIRNSNELTMWKTHLTLKYQFQKNCNLHQTMHKRRSDKLFENKCPIVNCHSTFQFPGSLETHLRYHRNDIDECHFVPIDISIQKVTNRISGLGFYHFQRDRRDKAFRITRLL